MRTRKIRVLGRPQSSVDQDQSGDLQRVRAQVQQSCGNGTLPKWQLQLLRGGDVQRVAARSAQRAYSERVIRIYIVCIDFYARRNISLNLFHLSLFLVMGFLLSKQHRWSCTGTRVSGTTIPRSKLQSSAPRSFVALGRRNATRPGVRQRKNY